MPPRNKLPGAHHTIAEAIGQTPLVQLQQIGKDLGADLYVKCEFLNPGGSIKDRIALQIILEAEEKGWLRPGGTIVEATSGNTGMGLAMIAACRGYKTIFTMPDKMSVEKQQALRAVGAEVVICPTQVAPEDPSSYYEVAKSIAQRTPGAYLPNQYHNPTNPQAHYASTGPEIWAQTGGQFAAFCAGIGTGGTISGTGKYLKERNPAIAIIGADPIGSIYKGLFYEQKPGEIKPYGVEGIGEDMLPSTLDFQQIDHVIAVSDQVSFQVAQQLMQLEGIFAGGSAGTAVAAALEFVRKEQFQDRMIIVLPDSAWRYSSKYLDPLWMAYNHFSPHNQLRGQVAELAPILAEGKWQVPLVPPTISIQQAMAMVQNQPGLITQLPGQAYQCYTADRLLHGWYQQASLELEQPLHHLAGSMGHLVGPTTPVEQLGAMLYQRQQPLWQDKDGQLHWLDSACLLHYVTKQYEHAALPT